MGPKKFERLLPRSKPHCWPPGFRLSSEPVPHGERELRARLVVGPENVEGETLADLRAQVEAVAERDFGGDAAGEDHGVVAAVVDGFRSDEEGVFVREPAAAGEGENLYSLVLEEGETSRNLVNVGFEEILVLVGVRRLDAPAFVPVVVVADGKSREVDLAAVVIRVVAGSDREFDALRKFLGFDGGGEGKKRGGHGGAGGQAVQAGKFVAAHGDLLVPKNQSR